VDEEWMKSGKGPPRFFHGGRNGRLLQAVVTASGVLGIPMPGAVTGVLLVLCRLDFIAAA
jgi:hypothetical protein